MIHSRPVWMCMFTCYESPTNRTSNMNNIGCYIHFRFPLCILHIFPNTKHEHYMDLSQNTIISNERHLVWTEFQFIISFISFTWKSLHCYRYNWWRNIFSLRHINGYLHRITMPNDAQQTIHSIICTQIRYEKRVNIVPFAFIIDVTYYILTKKWSQTLHRKRC